MRLRPSRPYNRVVTPTEDENRELIRRAQAGDLAARNECAERNMPLVVKLAGRLQGPNDFDDLVHEGFFGLLKAIDKFDLDAGTRFATYAMYYIRVCVQRARFGDSVIWLPAWTFFPGAAVIERCKTDKKYREKFAQMMADCELVKAGVGTLCRGEDQPEPSDASMMSRESDPAMAVEDRDTIEAMRRELDKLDSREREIVRRHFGLDGEWQGLREIGKSIGLSYERVRQIESKTIAGLRESLDRKSA